LKIFIVHNRYRVRGGEDVCVDNEVALLKGANLHLETFCPQTPNGLKAAFSAIIAPMGWGEEATLEQQLKEKRPNILHAHNLFPQFSPRLFAVARRLGIRVIQTLHNYRPLCINGLFLTPAGEICERCAIQNSYVPGVRRGCYRNSRTSSAVLSCHLRRADHLNWYDQVNRFIAPGSFLRDKFVSHGWPEEKITVQNHALRQLPDKPPELEQSYVIYLGRLSEEKGVRWLQNTYRGRKTAPPYPLRIAGSGPLESLIRKSPTPFVSFDGFLVSPQKEKVLSQASALVLTSQCYENAPLAILEAQSLGVPVIAPRLGGFTEMIEPGVSGDLYTPGDAESFWQAQERIKSLSSEAMMRLRLSTQQFAKNRYSPDVFVKKRIQIYEEVLK